MEIKNHFDYAYDSLVMAFQVLIMVAVVAVLTMMGEVFLLQAMQLAHSLRGSGVWVCLGWDDCPPSIKKVQQNLPRESHISFRLWLIAMCSCCVVWMMLMTVAWPKEKKISKCSRLSIFSPFFCFIFQVPLLCRRCWQIAATSCYSQLTWLPRWSLFPRTTHIFRLHQRDRINDSHAHFIHTYTQNDNMIPKIRKESILTVVDEQGHPCLHSHDFGDPWVVDSALKHLKQHLVVANL